MDGAAGARPAAELGRIAIERFPADIAQHHARRARDVTRRVEGLDRGDGHTALTHHFDDGHLAFEVEPVGTLEEHDVFATLQPENLVAREACDFADLVDVRPEDGRRHRAGGVECQRGDVRRQAGSPGEPSSYVPKDHTNPSASRTA